MSARIYQQIYKKSAGSSLLEVLMALLLLSVVALGLLLVQGRLLISSSSADLQAQAVQLISNDYHALRNFDDNQKRSYRLALSQIASSAATLQEYRRAAQAPRMDCYQGCSADAYAQSLAIRTANAAAQANVVITATTCPSGYCWVVMWGSAAFTGYDCQARLASTANADCLIMGGL